MICELVRAGKRVGITAVSHKVIRNLLDEVVAAAREEGISVSCVQKVSGKIRKEEPAIQEVTSNKKVPYNAQVTDLSERLPGARVGTVDKFQGQEAPVVIYSMTTSSTEEAPRGMEFLYSLNRLNVATSRARCACILVASPRLFEPECQSPRQMQLANAFCRYLELARTV